GPLKKSERIGQLMSMGGIGLLGTFLMAFFIGLGLSKVLGFSLAIFDQLGPLIASIAMPMIFIGAGLRLYPALKKELSGGRDTSGRKRVPASDPSALSQADTTQKLINSRSVDSVPSVTEGTTRNLDS
ncbi:MAG TPA: hypothetical protein VJX67_12720, partial [Blastocatellia bacterium]|nr:hypothetical protein [Blastocatellia bacterium]